MQKKRITGAVFLILLAALAVLSAQPAQDPQLLSRARAIHERVITIDTHVDIAGPQYATPAMDPGSPNSGLKCDLVKMKAGGLDAVFLAVFVGQTPALDPAGYKAAYDAAVAKFDAIHRLTEQMYPDRCALALSPDDVERIAKTGKRVILIGIENGYPLGEDLSLVRKFYDRGARYVTLTHSGHNQLGDSSSNEKEPMHNGLSPFGKKVVAEMNRVGMMVDVSHISTRSFWDVIAASKAPIIASHSGCKALAASERNLDDEQLGALSKNGGVIQVVALSDFLKAASPERSQAIQKLREELGLRRLSRQEMQKLTDEQRAELEKKRGTYEERMKAIDAQFPGATLKDFVDHIDHAVKVAGIDHVGIGTDFDGGGGIPGFNDHSEAPNVTVELVRRGYSEDAIRKIWGGNLLRAWREVQKVAAREQKTH